MVQTCNLAGFEALDDVDLGESERRILGCEGTVQALLSDIFSVPVAVQVLVQQEANGLIFRRSDLLAGPKVVCRTASHIPLAENRPGVVADILAAKLGLGEIIARHAIAQRRLLLAAGTNEHAFWRAYRICGDRLAMTIFEVFPRQPFLDIRFLKAGAATIRVM